MIQKFSKPYEHTGQVIGVSDLFTDGQDKGYTVLCVTEYGGVFKTTIMKYKKICEKYDEIYEWFPKWIRKMPGDYELEKSNDLNFKQHWFETQETVCFGI